MSSRTNPDSSPGEQSSQEANTVGPGDLPAPSVGSDLSDEDSRSRTDAVLPSGTIGRSSFLTVRDRREFLRELPSLARRAGDTSEAEQLRIRSGPPPAPLTPPAEEDAYLDRGMPIPDQYGMDRIAAFPRDAEWIYVYWELHGGRLNRMRTQYGVQAVKRARWVLRVETVRERTFHIVDVDLSQGCTYLHVTPDRRYRLELGFVTTDGRFVRVCSSQEVDMPRASVSEIVDERWGVVRSELEQLMRASGVEMHPDVDHSGSEGVKPVPRTHWPRARTFFSGMLQAGSGGGVSGAASSNNKKGHG